MTTHFETKLAMDQYQVKSEVDGPIDTPTGISLDIDSDSLIHNEPWVWLNILGEDDEFVNLKLTLAEASSIKNHLAFLLGEGS